VAERERYALRPAQAAAKEHRQDRAVAETFGGAGIRRIQQRLRLLDGKPVAKTDALGRDPFNAGDSVDQFGRQQPVVGGLHRQFAHGSNRHVDRNRAQPAGFQRNAPSAHGRLGEAWPGLLGKPGKKLIQPQIVDSLRDRRADACRAPASSVCAIASVVELQSNHSFRSF
jgi:hypothetical protein